MPLGSKVTKRIELPDEPGQWIEVRMPSLAILDKARQANSRKAFETMAGIDVNMLQGLRGAAADAVADASVEEYDWLTLLSSCILAWSYEEIASPDNISDLTPDVVQVLLAELLPRQTVEERKKGYVNSTNHSKVKA